MFGFRLLKSKNLVGIPSTRTCSVLPFHQNETDPDFHQIPVPASHQCHSAHILRSAFHGAGSDSEMAPQWKNPVCLSSMFILKITAE